MARLNPRAEILRKIIGRVIALGAVAGAVVLGGRTIATLDHRPRTQDAFLYADSVAISPEINGRLVTLHVRENVRVSKGDPLAEIDREPFELRLRQAVAQATALEKQIGLTTRQVAAQSSGAQAATTQIQRAKSQLALAHDTVERLSPLLGKGYATPQQLDEARANEEIARAAVTAAVQQAQQAHLAVGDTESLQAQLDAARAAVALAERDLRNTTIHAPFDGYVLGLEIAEGTFASVGRPLFTLVKADEWYAVGHFRETELAHITTGDTADIWLVGSNNRRVRGHVESIGWGVRPEGGGAPGLPAVGRTLNWVVIAQRFPVRIRLDELPVGLTRVGATASILVEHDGSP